MFNEYIPKRGSLLLSEPFMLDQNFERSVILLCEHNDSEGTVGLILNHRSVLYLSDVLEDVENTDIPLYFGGPVEGNALFFVHKAFDKLQSGTHIVDDLYWGGDFDTLKLLIQKKKIHPDEAKLFLGYSGWSPGQLDQEIKQNSWAVHNSFNIDLAFITDGEDLWKEALISMGPKYAHVANFPKRPEFN
ncbi:YqgE/AlgH family protein [Sphingobacterium lactis]|uniref:Putative transcriptional regulator n=1 Tax=Sphingobacterium lactis TaxID=797291 RepID=A0A1H6CPD2_9SPHI|nr:YqgE/AlgH family protein [Sphingobacterium lactis]SEG74573.1 putative transcriptional regulator [Sphingobacterium lactis]